MNILFVGQTQSVHFARLAANLERLLPDSLKQSLTLYLLNSYPFPCASCVDADHFSFRILQYQLGSDVHADDPLSDGQESIESFMIGEGRSIRRPSEQALDGFARDLKQAGIDIIWLADLQTAGYLYLDHLAERVGHAPKLVLTTYGNDLFLFQHSLAHLGKIRALLERVDCLQCETMRDVGIAQRLGYGGEWFCDLTSSFDTAAGFPFVEPGPDPGFSMALTGSDVRKSPRRVLLEMADPNGTLGHGARDWIDGVHLIRATRADRDLANLYTACLPPLRASGWLSTEDLYATLRESTVYVHDTISDGIAVTCVEAALSAALPITTRCNAYHELLSPEARDLTIVPDPYDEAHGFLRRIERIHQLSADDRVQLARGIQHDVLRILETDHVQQRLLRLLALA